MSLPDLGADSGTAMKQPKVNLTGRISALAARENELSEALSAAADEVARIESFDQEQRAEVYAILDSMKADTDAHRHVVGRWVNDRTGQVADV